MRSVGAITEEVAHRRRELGELFAAHRRGEGQYDLSEEQCAEVRRRNEELAHLCRELEQARGLQEADRRNREELERLERPLRRPVPAQAGPRSLGELVVECGAIQSHREGRRGVVSVVDVDLKTLMTTSAGWDPEDTRTGKVLLSAQERPRVADLLTITQTDQSTVLYMEETTFTNNAAETAEGGTYGEAALVYTERSSEVRKIAVSLPVTDEMLEDETRLQGLIDGRLRFMLSKRLDSQILVGNGTAPNLRGVNNLAGILTQAKGTDPVFDAIYKGIVQVAVNAFEDCDAIVMHPTDWQDLRLTRTADGIYILGNPGDDVTPRLFGLPVVLTTHQTQNQAVVGSFRMHGELALRRGVEVQISNSHGTFFVEGKQMLRADMRAALIFDRATAFCLVTGI